MKRRSKKGFTLAELLIVIAIIAILIAIMFPVFGAQLDKAKAAAELANVRARYSELVADKMLGTAGDLTTLASSVDVSLEELGAALTYKGSKITYTAKVDDGSGNVTTHGSIEVSYKDYKRSFVIDDDVTVTSTTEGKTEFEKSDGIN